MIRLRSILCCCFFCKKFNKFVTLGSWVLNYIYHDINTTSESQFCCVHVDILSLSYAAILWKFYLWIFDFSRQMIFRYLGWILRYIIEKTYISWHIFFHVCDIEVYIFSFCTKMAPAEYWQIPCISFLQILYLDKTACYLKLYDTCTYGYNN